ncbi:hypothetical protein [Nonomuraea sp. NPDC050202]|uniref:hypothetical protein n=1 Tax=Nonomuraea sp. NPDC050202 TaxID=3155035 RepID=UPI0033CD137E
MLTHPAPAYECGDPEPSCTTARAYLGYGADGLTFPTPGQHRARPARHRRPVLVCGGSLTLGLGPVTEVGFNGLHTRMGIAMTNTQTLTERQRPAGTINLPEGSYCSRRPRPGERRFRKVRASNTARRQQFAPLLPAPPAARARSPAVYR